MTEFKPGDTAAVALVGEIDQFGRPRFGEGHTLCDDNDGEGMDVTKLRNVYEAIVTPYVETPEPAVPYTDPHDGDEVEVTVRGTLRKTWSCDDDDCYGDGDCDHRQWKIERRVGGEIRSLPIGQSVWDEGRVSLVKAAAPQYQPGRIYYSAAMEAPFLYAGGDGQKWFKCDDEPGWFAEDELPADLVPMDLVPAQVKP